MSPLPEFLTHPYITFAARAFAASLLAAGGLGKLANLREFKEILYAYQILPKRAVPPVAYSLPVVEVLTGGALLFGLFSPAAQYLAAGLFLVFVLAVAGNLLRGRREVPCGCFGGSLNNISWQIVIRNVALVGLVFLSLGRFVPLCLSLLALYGVASGLRLARRLGRAGLAIPLDGQAR